MAKVEIIRRGAGRSVIVEEKIANALVKSGKFSYVSSTKVSKSKRTVKAKHASSSGNTVKVQEVQAQKVEEKVAKPMTSATVAVKPTRRVMSKDELLVMTKADLKAMGLKMGVNLLPSDSKDEFVSKIYRYMRRDMRAQ